jgi:hypothetical protein
MSDRFIEATSNDGKVAPVGPTAGAAMSEAFMRTAKMHPQIAATPLLDKNCFREACTCLSSLEKLIP